MRDRASRVLRRSPWLFAALLAAALLIANILADPSFARSGSWPAELIALAPIVLVAFASTPAIVSGGGGLDLSVGPLAVLANVVLVNGLLVHGIGSPWVDVAILIALGITVGALNGILVTYFRYIPIVATTCMMFILLGIGADAGANPTAAGHNWTEHLTDTIGPIPYALFVIVIPALAWVALSRTSYHRNLYCTGGNDATAFSAGINVVATRIVAYALGGAFAAAAGIALTAGVQTSEASLGTFYILIGVTGVALGGTPLTGGRGGLRGSFFGAAVLYLLQTFLTSVNVSGNWIDVAYGGLLLMGVAVGAASVRSAQPQGAAA